MSDMNPRRINEESRFDQRDSSFGSRPTPDYFLSQQKPYGQFQRYSEERGVFSEPRDQRQMRTEPHSYRECFAQYPGGSGFDQTPTEYQPFGGPSLPNIRDREMNYSRNHGDLREGFFDVGHHQYPQERNFTATAGYQKEDDLEYEVRQEEEEEEWK